MKIANIMCFARCYNAVDYQFLGTKMELEMTTETGVDHTFLLQYDAICNQQYQQLFREKATERTEIGLWLEIVEPLTTACGMPYRSEMEVKWDYHIIPGFLMGYTPRERETLVDEAMRKFSGARPNASMEFSSLTMRTSLSVFPMLSSGRRTACPCRRS